MDIKESCHDRYRGMTLFFTAMVAKVFRKERKDNLPPCLSLLLGISIHKTVP